MSVKANVLLVTVNKRETSQLFDVFNKATGEQTTPESIEGRIYNYLGTINETKYFHTISEMGAGGLGGSQQTVHKGIAALHPTAVIGVGIAFGTKKDKQSIGDVLVSKQLALYELQRVEDNKIIPRGDRAHASTRLVNLFRNAAQTTWEGAKVEIGLMLSGEKLLRSRDFVQRLLEAEPEAIGGEMEGSGVYVASQDYKVDWIVIKAICDWGDRDKSENEEENQETAARNAAQFLVEALKEVSLRERTPTIEENKITQEQITELYRPINVRIRRKKLRDLETRTKNQKQILNNGKATETQIEEQLAKWYRDTFHDALDGTPERELCEGIMDYLEQLRKWVYQLGDKKIDSDVLFEIIGDAFEIDIPLLWMVIDGHTLAHPEEKPYEKVKKLKIYLDDWKQSKIDN